MQEKFLMEAVKVKEVLNRLTKYEPEWKKIEEKANSLKVNSDESQILASDMLSQIKVFGDKIEKKRVEVYDEMYPKEKRSIVKKVNNLAKAYKGRLEELKRVVQKKYLAYDRIKQEEAARAEARRLEAERKAREEAEEKNLFIPDGLKVAPEVEQEVTPEVKNMTSTGLGSTYKKKVKSFEVVDFSKVPDEFKLLNETAIRAEMRKEKQPEIPGIKWTVVDELATRVNR